MNETTFSRKTLNDVDWENINDYFMRKLRSPFIQRNLTMIIKHLCVACVMVDFIASISFFSPKNTKALVLFSHNMGGNLHFASLLSILKVRVRSGEKSKFYNYV